MKKKDSDVLIASLQRRLKHLMVRVLDESDNRLTGAVDPSVLEAFKVDIKHGFNDAIRANDSEIRDYEINYRPIRWNPDNSLFMTRTFIENLQSITFSAESVTFTSKADDYRILASLRDEVGAGVVNFDKDIACYRVVGLNDCINHIIPLLDRLTLKQLIQSDYQAWRQEIVKAYEQGVA
jgi:hypothetical protein